MWRLIGPALLFSGAAIGTSHLIQSTRAGAIYGLALAVVIVLACVLKYPAYRFSVDYGHSTHRSLVAGYRELGRWAPILFALVSILIVPVIFAALAAATAGIATVVFGLTIPIPVLGVGLLSVVTAVLLYGGYDWLDRLNRVLMAFLVVSTLVTTAMVLPRVEWGTLGNIDWVFDPKAILFVVALAGFMPNAMDVSVAQSMWVAEAEAREEPGQRSTLGDARGAFLSGYIMTGILALCFCIMGAGVMHADGIAPAGSAPGFAAQIIGLYKSVLGEAAAVLASIAALTVMLTTLFAALDIGGRHIASTWQEISGRSGEPAFDRTYRAAIPVLIVLAGLVLFFFMTSFTDLLDLATSAAFLNAPIIATLNHLVVTRCEMPEEARPRAAIQTLNIVAIVVMSGLAIAYFAL